MVERGIGQWKRRFHVLHSEIRLEPAKVCKVIYACAVLHNFCKAKGVPIPVVPVVDARGVPIPIHDAGDGEDAEVDDEASPYQAAVGPAAQGVQA